MAAVSNDSQPRVDFPAASNLSPFSRYHAFVMRSLWSPLAPDFVGLVKDLIGRAVVITTAVLGGYLFAALFSIRYWYNNPPPSSANQPLAPTSDHPVTFALDNLESSDRPARRLISQLCYSSNPGDIHAAPHNHNQAIKIDLLLYQEQILKLDHPHNLREEDCLYTGDLTMEKDKILLLMQEPKIKLLIEYIFKMAQIEKEASKRITYAIQLDLTPETNSKRYALAALFVILGIKPALVVEYTSDKELISLLTSLTHDHPNLSCKPFPNNVTGYFVNEQPFHSFDPRNFIDLSSQISLMDAISTCWPLSSREDLGKRARVANQFLAYLLGFGPTWEYFEMNFPLIPKFPVSCCFNKNHYYELGKVLYQYLLNKEASRSEIEDLGFAYHSQVDRIERVRFEESNVCGRMFYRTGTRCFIGGIAARTDYIKKSYTLKKWVMETYFSELGD